MSLARLKQRLFTADFAPHTLDFEVGQLADVVDQAARDFLKSSWGGNERPTFDQLLNAERWSADLQEAYYELETDVRMQVLAVSSVYAHECQHKIDLLATPFAAAWHGRACLELLRLQHRDGLVVEALRKAGHAAMRELPRKASAIRVSDGPDALQARVLWFDAQRGAAPRFVRPGWIEDDPMPVMSLFGRELKPVLVHGLLPSVEFDDQGTYLRPLTILEGRAVATSALQILTRLGGTDRAAGEVAMYLEAFYSPASEFADYRFLLDLFAQLWGESDFGEAVRGRGAAWLKQALLITTITGWYALHAPSLMAEDGENGLVNTSPVMRLIVALQFIERTVARGERFETGVELLTAIDNDPTSHELEIASCRNVLRHSIEFVQAVRKENARNNIRSELREHFESILSVIEVQLEGRLGAGFESQLGMPDGGNLLLGFQSATASYHLLPQANPATATVRRWFAARENLLFRNARPPGFWEELNEFIGPPEQRFARDAYEPTKFGIPPEGPPAVWIPQKPPATLARPNDVTTQWGAYRGDEWLLLLTIEFDTGQDDVQRRADEQITDEEFDSKGFIADDKISLDLLFRRPQMPVVADILRKRRVVLVFEGDNGVTVDVLGSPEPAIAFLTMP